MSLDGHPHELIERGLEGTLSPSEEEALRLHLKSCAECAEEYAFARRAREELGRAGSVPAPAEMAAMRSGVEARLAAGPALVKMVERNVPAAQRRFGEGDCELLRRSNRDVFSFGSEPVEE